MATPNTTSTDRLSAALTTLEEGILRLTQSDEWARFLKFQATFHDYSFSNTLLIMAQCSDSTRVAGFKAWQKLGRCVKKGEKALWILAPIVKRRAADSEVSDRDKDSEQGEPTNLRRIVGFRPVPVFDVQQTEGGPLPALVRHLSGEDDGGLFERLKAHAEAKGCPVTVEDFEGRANGFYEPERHAVTVRASLSATQRAKTLAHELAHSILHRDLEVYRAHRGDCELEAESVAFVVLAHAGIDAGSYSFGYVSTWQGGGDEAITALKTSATRIQQTARTIIDGVGLLAERLEQPPR